MFELVEASSLASTAIRVQVEYICLQDKLAVINGLSISGVAQWQSSRLLTEWSSVRIRPPEHRDKE